MTRRNVHYETALEDYLCSRDVPYVAVDDSRRVIFAGAKVKSFDFLIYPNHGPHLIVDVKGRKFPYESGNARRYWENWVSRDDLEGLAEWQRVFGGGYRAAFVFAYWLSGDRERWPADGIHPFQESHYAFYCVRLEDYAAHTRVRSRKWDTVFVPGAAFRELARPLAGCIG